MELVKLTEKEFAKFAVKHRQASFYQTVEWGHLKETNNWQMHLLGLKDGKKIVAGCLLLSKMTPVKRKMFYSPRGFLIDYSDYDLLKEFTYKIKEYVKKEKGIFIKIRKIESVKNSGVSWSKSIDVPEIPLSYNFTGIKKTVIPNALTIPEIVSIKILVILIFTRCIKRLRIIRKYLD